MRFLPAAIRHTRLDSDEIRKRQIAALRGTLMYAGRNVPYWRDLFAGLRFSPEDVTGAHDLEALPMLTKDVVREQGQRLVSDEFVESRLIRRQTGGSTGEPLTFYVDPLSHERQMAVLWRDFWRVGIGVADIQAKIWGYGKSHAGANAFAGATRRLYLDAFHAGDEDLARWVGRMRAVSVDVVYGYASAVFALSRFLRENRLRIPSVRVVCTTAERLHPEMRTEIAAAFSTPVIDMYGAHETVRLASECFHGGMHLDTDAAVLELIEDEESAALGRRLLLTTLLNRAMPFIRYDLGDRADPIEEPCPCGERLPLISIRSAKEQQLFSLPSGAVVHTTLFTKELYRLPGVLRFQVRRTGEGSVDLLVVPTPGADGSLRMKLDDAARRCERAVGSPITVSPRIVCEIPRSPRGKQPIVFSEIGESRLRQVSL